MQLDAWGGGVAIRQTSIAKQTLVGINYHVFP